MLSDANVFQKTSVVLSLFSHGEIASSSYVRFLPTGKAGAMMSLRGRHDRSNLCVIVFLT
jgi:hypothetical protein